MRELIFLISPTDRNGSFPDIHERPLTATSGSSWIRRQWSDDVSLNDRFRLQAAVRQSDVRPATIDPDRTLEPVEHGHGVAALS